MSAMSFARQAFSRDKPHSSTTDWIDILTGVNVEEEAYDGIPELVDSINLQAAGPTEASRAIRKKLKHGNSHQQYRALVILKALVENCGHKFQTSFADGQLTDALKNMTIDPGTNQKVKRKLVAVLASWHQQFKSDPSMALVAGLYKQCKPDSRRISQQNAELAGLGLSNFEYERKKLEKDEAKKKAKREKEEARERERIRREQERSSGNKRGAFDFEKEKPKVLTSIVDASQASSNLVNAITLVNPETDSLQSNERVQECLTSAKQSRRAVVRYIQLVENEELIGTLIETNERIIAAMEMYDKLSTRSPQPADASSAVTAGLAAVNISTSDSEVNKLQEKQRVAVERAKQHESIKRRGSVGRTEEGIAQLHPDLQDLSFGPLGSSSNNLPAPLRPSALSDDGNGPDEHTTYDARGSLSDFSDYESSDEEMHNATAASSKTRKVGRDYVNVSDGPDDEDDPFADPFADEVAIGPSKKV